MQLTEKHNIKKQRNNTHSIQRILKNTKANYTSIKQAAQIVEEV